MLEIDGKNLTMRISNLGKWQLTQLMLRIRYLMIRVQSFPHFGAASLKDMSVPLTVRVLSTLEGTQSKVPPDLHLLWQKT